MRVQHPRALDDVPGNPPAKIDVNGETRVLDSDGSFEADDNGYMVDHLAERFGVKKATIRTDAGRPEAAEPGETICTCDVGEACDRCGGDCPTVKNDGEVCGSERPCQYHD